MHYKQQFTHFFHAGLTNDKHGQYSITGILNKNVKLQC